MPQQTLFVLLLFVPDDINNSGLSPHPTLVQQDRIHFWHEQFHRHHAELQDFKKLTAVAVDGLKNDHGVLLKDVEGVAARVERVDRNLDHVESWSAPRACANSADKVLEQDAWGLEEARGREEEEEWEELQSQVSGELRKGNDLGFDRSSPFRPGR